MRIAVAYSGGKDSIYLLLKAVREGHAVTAFSVDTGFLSKAAWENLRVVPDTLGIEHVIIRVPNDLRSLYQNALARPNEAPFGNREGNSMSNDRILATIGLIVMMLMALAWGKWLRYEAKRIKEDEQNQGR